MMNKESPAGGRGGVLSGRSGHNTNHNPVHTLLERLEGVQPSGRGWRAQCPACGGKSRKLSIAEADNGSVLVHCFGGCTAAAVVQAAGLSLGDLFPRRLRPLTDAERRDARRRIKDVGRSAALGPIAHAAAMVECACRKMLSGQSLTAGDLKEVQTAGDVLGDARQVFHGR